MKVAESPGAALARDGRWSSALIDQTRLPHQLATATLTTLDAAAAAITRMVIRGAPLIGATAPTDCWRCEGCVPMTRSRAPTRCCSRHGRPRSISKWALDEMVAAVRDAHGERMRPAYAAPPRSARRISPSTRRSAATASR